MKVTAIIRKDQPDKDGLCKILLRINRGDKRQYLTTEHKVKLSQFKKGKVVGHPEANRINSALQKEIILWEEGEKKASKVTFESYANALIDHGEKTGTLTKGTVRHYRSETRKFLLFTEDLPLNKINTDLLKSYHVHMKGLGNLNNTIWGSFKFIRTVLSRAVKEQLIHANPFTTFQPVAYKQTTRVFLTAEEVRKISELDIEPENLNKIRTWFLIQCHTGLRVGDLKHLNIPQILKEKRIVIVTSKTGTTVSQPLNPQVKKLLQDAAPFDITTEDYNRQLKVLASLAGIKKHLTSHVGRHSAAIRMAELGISKEVASKLLGHTKGSTTDIYYKIQDARVDKEFSRFSYD